jgi:hypothetical protein
MSRLDYKIRSGLDFKTKGERIMRTALIFCLLFSTSAFSMGKKGDPCRLMTTSIQENCALNDDCLEELKAYKVITVNAGMSKAARTKIQTVLKGRPMLGYAGVTDTNLYQGWDNDFQKRMEAIVPKRFLVTNLDTGKPHPIWPGNPPLNHIVLTQTSADLLVKAYTEVAMADGWSGLFIDQHYPPPVPRSYRIRSEIDTKRLDIDGDGKQDTWQKWQALYAKWRPYFTEQFRKANPQAIVITNSAISRLSPSTPWYGLIDPNINGVTMESVGNILPYTEAMTWFQSQFAVSQYPKMSSINNNPKSQKTYDATTKACQAYPWILRH